jgi:hypothetical protein
MGGRTEDRRSEKVSTMFAEIMIFLLVYYLIVCLMKRLGWDD